MYDCKDNVWYEAKLSGAQKPEPRSSFSFLPHPSGAVLYGGYSRVKATTTAAAVKQGKGGPQRNIVKPMVHQDTWFLRVTMPTDDAAAGTIPNMKWERRKRPANAPNPVRAGASMAFHKGRGILFGGVHDVEESEEGIESEFFNDLFVWNIDRNRFFPLVLRRPKVSAKRQVLPTRTRDRGKADEEELLRNLAALEATGSVAASSGNEVDNRMTSAHDDDDDNDAGNKYDAEAERKEYPVRFEMPHRRFNAQLTVQDDTLFIFGGTFERGDLEFTFDDLYTIDLGKLDGVREIFYREPENWNAKEEVSDDDEDDEMDDDADGSDDDEDEDNEDGTMSVDTRSTAPTSPGELSRTTTINTTLSAASIADVSMEVETESAAATQADGLPYPRAFESLRDFFARTTDEWTRTIIRADAVSASSASPSWPAATTTSTGATTGGKFVKELRKLAFEAAEQRWWDCREEIRSLEDAHEDAGIGEVVSLAQRTRAPATAGADGGGGSGAGIATGPGRRR